jgi:hypothetical protein
MPERLVHYTFVETPIFSKRLRDLASPETLEALQSELIENPERWPMVRGLHGARKGRVADYEVWPREEREFSIHLSLSDARGTNPSDISVREEGAERFEPSADRSFGKDHCQHQERGLT